MKKTYKTASAMVTNQENLQVSNSWPLEGHHGQEITHAYSGSLLQTRNKKPTLLSLHIS